MSTKNNRPKPVNVICTALFVGIILTFAFFFGVTAMTSHKTTDDSSDDTMSDTVRNMTFRRFSESFYCNEKLGRLNDSIEYLLLGSIGSDDIMLGSDGFLFDAGTNE